MAFICPKASGSSHCCHSPSVSVNVCPSPFIPCLCTFVSRLVVAFYCCHYLSTSVYLNSLFLSVCLFSPSSRTRSLVPSSLPLSSSAPTLANSVGSMSHFLHPPITPLFPLDHLPTPPLDPLTNCQPPSQGSANTTPTLLDNPPPHLIPNLKI